MDGRDRQAIDELFGKIAEVERHSGSRDNEAESYLAAQVARQPGAPYYMAQTIVAQEQALLEAQRRIEELQSAPPAGSGGFLGGIFGGGRRDDAPRRLPDREAADGRAGPWSARSAPGGTGGRFGSGTGGGLGGGMGGGGFLAGAAQTAVGVAGGVVLGNMLADWLTPDAASPEGGSGDLTADNAAAGDLGAEDAAAADPFSDGSFDMADAGDFDAGDF